MKKPNYTRPVNFTETNLYGCGKGDDVYTVEEFLALVDRQMFTDYDGHGNPVKGRLSDWDILIKPSTAREKIPSDATHIVWYNR